MIELLGVIGAAIGGTLVFIFFYRRSTFVGTRNVVEYGFAIPDSGLDEPTFLGADTTNRAMTDAVDVAEALQGTPMDRTTAFREGV